MKHKIFALVLFVLVVNFVYGQEIKTIKVIVPNKTDEVYITGNQASLGNWNPNSIKLERSSDFEREIRLELNYPAEFKFTRGDWNSEGIITSLDNNPNSKLEDLNSRSIYMIKGWSDESDGKALGMDYRIKTFDSKFLGTSRQIKIVLPDQYDPSKKHPVFYTTDAGGNIFTIAKDNLKDLSIDEYRLIPQAILVGIVHGKSNNEYNRNKDLDVFYKESGKNFKEFLFKELIPYIDATYSTSGFNVMIGHSNGAEYNHFLLLEKDNPFRGFISLSTNFYSKDVREEMAGLMKNHKGENLYYFVANATNDSPDRIEAGNDYEQIYDRNKNDLFSFKKVTYEANHNSVVPLALADGIQFIFKDYKNFNKYPSFTSFSENYLKDVKRIYGIEEQYEMEDLSSFLMDILIHKKKEDLEDYLQFVEDQKLWQSPYMKEPGGMDEVNKGNFYFMMNDYEKCAKSFEQASYKLGSTTMPRVYFGNLDKGIESFKSLENYQDLMALLLRSKSYLESKSDMPQKRTTYELLLLNYYIAELSRSQGLEKAEGKQALAYCKAHYQKNSVFSETDLSDLR